MNKRERIHLSPYVPQQKSCPPWTRHPCELPLKRFCARMPFCPAASQWTWTPRRALAPTLVDSIYFCRWGETHNPISETAASLCGYTNSPSGLSLSNLKQLEMPDDLPVHYESLYFVPPCIPNVRAVVGMSTFQNTLTLALSAPDPFPEALLDTALAHLKTAME